MTARKLVFRYVLFAILATLANLSAQRVMIMLDDTEIGFIKALALGTLMGLILKYVLDKIWIYEDFDQDLKAHGKKMTRYMGTGIFTTALFWIIETVFWLTWQTDLMREIGAVVGLILGYAIKYHLDKRYVFTNERLAKSR